ncbi:hypothetical protein CQ010_08685 [Arthrobacter sp. MYb211]|uniref:LysR family transcriptional regulator n=1 Tax=unclassified Arthrobacter TaxID=235627 RepID=UPI000CFB4C35|nr:MULTISPECIES: LysR family transcriptional regulator [unclassified Arthrobacter]PRA11576.1 hypothetical protein CQ015_09320 [Arthrobacter sp. MYb221]PRC07923.1 hypothetical protein CQ010_08685 [Arthrobacter sp. MYb211]
MATHLNSSNISLAQIAAVITVVDYGSFTAAADILGISQPSLSRRIRALEQTLGMPVFRAAGRNMLLTEAGRSIIPAGRRALREISSIDALASSTRSLDSGSLRIAGLPSLIAGVLPEYLGPFHRNHPGIQIEIVSVEDHEQLIDSVRLGRADLAFGVDERIPADLQTRFVRKQRFTAVLSTDLAHTVRTALDSELLGGLTLVTLPQGTSTRLITDEVYRNLGATAPRIITTTQRDALVQLNIAVGGITMVPQVLASTAEVFGGLQVPLAADAGRPIGAIFRKDSFKNPALEEFLDHL